MQGGGSLSRSRMMALDPSRSLADGSGLSRSALGVVRHAVVRRPCIRICRSIHSLYGLDVPPCFDVYVWVKSADRPATLARFIDHFVDLAHPGDPRFEAFIRTFVTEEPLPGDAEALADLRRDPEAGSAFSLYLGAIGFDGAIVTLTEEGDVVLGLSLDDPMNDPAVERQASEVLTGLLEDFGGSAGIGGVELHPPQSRAQWHEDGLVMLRVGSI